MEICKCGGNNFHLNENKELICTTCGEILEYQDGIKEKIIPDDYEEEEKEIEKEEKTRKIPTKRQDVWRVLEKDKRKIEIERENKWNKFNDLMKEEEEESEFKWEELTPIKLAIDYAEIEEKYKDKLEEENVFLIEELINESNQSKETKERLEKEYKAKLEKKEQEYVESKKKFGEEYKKRIEKRDTEYEELKKKLGDAKIIEKEIKKPKSVEFEIYREKKKGKSLKELCEKYEKKSINTITNICKRVEKYNRQQISKGLIHKNSQQNSQT